MGTVATANRLANPAKYLSIAVIIVSLILIMSTLPIDRGIQWLETTVQGLGIAGPLLFGVVYVVAAVLFIPGSALTLAAGAVFGLAVGTITVSIASVTAAGVAFLIARYFARDTVAQTAKKYPKFAAIEEAIRQGDWRIVGMLRLSPAIPFSLSNYLYGLTPVRFWPYVFASWVAMFPGTFMYVYLGRVSAAGLSAASGGAEQSTTGQTVLLVVGLLATVAVTVYVTRLARRSLEQYTDIESTEEPKEEPMQAVQPTSVTWPWGATLAVVLAVALGCTAAYARRYPKVVLSLFGPPSVTLNEAYAASSGTESFDHASFDALLRKYVDADGWVDYAALANEAFALDAYIGALEAAPFDALSRDAKLALLINAYNAYTLRLILDYYPLESIKDIPASKRWDHARWKVAGETVSLNQIEHELIRGRFSEPRIHFAVNCASVGCPPLRSEAFTADKLEAQLEDQTRYVSTHDRWLQYKAGADTIQLTQLYDWYGDDFVQDAGSTLAFVARYVPELKAAIDAGNPPAERFLNYDWTLNSVDNPAAKAE